jgi:hypothetical protein
MKTIPRLLVLFSAMAAAALFAQNDAPAPTVTANPPPPPPSSARESTPVDGLIHVQKLPTTAQLTADAEAEGMSVMRMQQLPDRIIVTYRYASGNTRTFAYTTTLPEDPETATNNAPAAAPVASSSPNYTVIYSEPAPVYYSPRYVPAYDPYWPTTSVSIGLGFGRTFGFGGYGGRGYYGPSRYYAPSYRGHGRH